MDNRTDEKAYSIIVGVKWRSLQLKRNKNSDRKSVTQSVEPGKVLAAVLRGVQNKVKVLTMVHSYRDGKGKSSYPHIGPGQSKATKGRVGRRTPPPTPTLNI